MTGDHNRRVVQAFIEEDLELLTGGEDADELRATLEAIRAGIPPEDPEMQRRVLSHLSPRPRWVRWLSVAPVAVSSGVLLVGMGVLGGVPGWGVSGSSGDVSALVSAVHLMSEAGGVLLDVQRAAAHIVPSGGHLLGLGVALAGALALARTRRRRVLQ